MKRINFLVIMLFGVSGLWRVAAQHVVVFNDTVCDTEQYGVLRTNIQALMTSAYKTDTTAFAYDADFTNASDVLQGGTPLAIDDEFSDVIDIGFTFYFFGEAYTRLVVGSNGDIVFQPSIAGTYDSWSINAQQLIPDITLPYYDPWNGTSYGSIMGAYHDIHAGRRIQGVSEMKYELRGTAPHRKLIITYHEMPQFSCTSLLTSQQIVLNEDDYSIEVHLKHKPVCSGWNSGLATLGIQNDDASCGYYPGDGTTSNSILVNRNTSVFSIDSMQNPESWKFTPASMPTITWYDANRNVIAGATADSLVVPLNNNLGPYTCEVTYTDCHGNRTTEYDEGEVIVVPTPVVDLGPDQYRCKDEEIVLDATPSNANDFPSGALHYQWSKDGQVLPNATSAQYTVTEPGTYTVEVSSGGCSAMDEITVENYINDACIIPEVITPDGDGKNDAFVLDYLDGKYGIQKIEIFNRWGTKIFEKENGYSNEWHGQSKSGKDVPSASYFYVVKLKNGEVKTGYVQVVK